MLTKQDKREFLKNDGWRRKGSVGDEWTRDSKKDAVFVPMEEAFRIAWKGEQKAQAEKAVERLEVCIVDQLRTARSQAVDCAGSLMEAMGEAHGAIPFKVLMDMSVREFIVKVGAMEGIRFVYKKPEEYRDPKPAG